MNADKNKIFSTNEQMVVSSKEKKVASVSRLLKRFDLYPENKRRPVNKTVFRNEYFQMTYNVKTETMAISSRGEIVYSAIPYDTARNYIQRAAILFLMYPEAVDQYIESHKKNVERYLILSLFQVTGERLDTQSFEVVQAYNEIIKNPLLKIQVYGRLLQHDETGPLSANLAGKFLFSENRKTGISGYLSEYIAFIIQLTQSLPVMTDGKQIQLIETSALKEELAENMLSEQSNIQLAVESLPQQMKSKIECALMITNQSPGTLTPILRSKAGKELSEVRKNYVAHSVPPKELEQYFENVLPTENTNKINVVSDIHAIDGKLPFVNKAFNILAGDLPDSHMTDETICGISVLGNHDLKAALPNEPAQNQQWQKWQPFMQEEWFQKLIENPDDSWYLLPTGDHDYYDTVKHELAKRFPKINVLNNSSIMYEEIRYIGLTIPVALVERKKEQQAFIFRALKKLLAEDKQCPTVIISHAPLFNELSMLSPESKSYNKDYQCIEPRIEQLFECYNILGVIHGHHHIPASKGRYKIVTFGGQECFVVCSIYSKMNTGFDLTNLVKNYIGKS